MGAMPGSCMLASGERVGKSSSRSPPAIGGAPAVSHPAGTVATSFGRPASTPKGRRPETLALMRAALFSRSRRS